MAEVVEADRVQFNMKELRLEAPLVYVGSVKELTNLCSEYEILIAAQVPCAGDQIRRTGIKLASPCSPYVGLTRDETLGQRFESTRWLPVRRHYRKRIVPTQRAAKKQPNIPSTLHTTLWHRAPNRASTCACPASVPIPLLADSRRAPEVLPRVRTLGHRCPLDQACRRRCL